MIKEKTLNIRISRNIKRSMEKKVAECKNVSGYKKVYE